MRYLVVGLLLASLLVGCSEPLPEISRAEACANYQRQYDALRFRDRGSNVAVYLLAQIEACRLEGIR